MFDNTVVQKLLGQPTSDVENIPFGADGVEGFSVRWISISTFKVIQELRLTTRDMFYFEKKESIVVTLELYQHPTHTRRLHACDLRSTSCPQGHLFYLQTTSSLYSSSLEFRELG